MPLPVRCAAWRRNKRCVEAMAWEKHCEAEHIPGRLIPLPRELSAGCGLAWRMPPEDWQLWQSRIDPAAYDAAAVVEQ